MSAYIFCCQVGGDKFTLSRLALQMGQTRQTWTELPLQTCRCLHYADTYTRANRTYTYSADVHTTYAFRRLLDGQGMLPCPRKRRNRQNCRRLQRLQQRPRRRQRPTPPLKQQSDLLPLRPLQQQLRRPLLLWLLRWQMWILS